VDASAVVAGLPGGPVAPAHLNRGKTRGDEIFGKLRRDVVRLSGMVVMQRHPVHDTGGTTDDPDPHATVRLQTICQSQHHRRLVITMKKQGLLARSGSENGKVPHSTYPRRR